MGSGHGEIGVQLCVANGHWEFVLANGANNYAICFPPPTLVAKDVITSTPACMRHAGAAATNSPHEKCLHKQVAGVCALRRARELTKKRLWITQNDSCVPQSARTSTEQMLH